MTTAPVVDSIHYLTPKEPEVVHEKTATDVQDTDVSSGQETQDQKSISTLSKLFRVAGSENSLQYSRRAKWGITLLIAAAAAIDAIAINIFYPSLVPIAHEFACPPSIANLVVALPTASQAILPLYWSHFSDLNGRRVIHIVSLGLYIVFNIACALSTSIAMLTAFRVIAAGAICGVTINGTAIVADIWPSEERGKAMGVYYVGIFIGPTLGPIIGGLLTQRWGWRSAMWFLVVYAALIFVLVFVALPETRNRPSVDKAPPPKAKLSVIAGWLWEPLQAVKFFRFPAIFLTSYYASITYLVLMAMLISVQRSFASAPYNFSPSLIGISFLPCSLGLLAGDLIGGPWSDSIMRKHIKSSTENGSKEQENGESAHGPESRMGVNAVTASIVFIGGLLWYGWFIAYGYHKILPMVGAFIVGFGTGINFSLAATMLVEFIPAKSATLIALNSLFRNAFATIGSAIGEPSVAAIGNGWTFTIMAAIILISSTTVLALMRWKAKKWHTALVGV